MSFKLTADQQLASDTFIKFLTNPDEKFMIIQGSSGSGKSTLIKYLLKTMELRAKLYATLLRTNKSKNDFCIQLAATTNKAAAVVGKLVGKEARTIHSLLGLKVVDNYKTGKSELQKTRDYSFQYNTLLVLDEASFMNKALYNMIDASTPGCKVLLVGDENQLVSVNEKQSMVAQLKHTKVVLNEVKRNSGTIETTGALFKDAVKSGKFSPIQYTDDKLIHVNGDEFKDLVQDAYTSQSYSVNSARIMAWTNRKVLSYNAHIRAIKGLPDLFAVGEDVITNNPIMQDGLRRPVDSHVIITNVIANHSKYGVKGRILEIDHVLRAFVPNDIQDAKNLLKRLAKEKNWVDYFKVKNEWLDLRSTYASTIHKAQGSEYDTVFIDLTDIGKCNRASDVARMLYVGITRSKSKCICYGELPAKYRGG